MIVEAKTICMAFMRANGGLKTFNTPVLGEALSKGAAVGLEVSQGLILASIFSVELSRRRPYITQCDAR